MDAVMTLAREHNLHVIEDGAQAIGARYRGRGCGAMGDFGTYSFFPSKNLGGFGDGGMVVCNDDDLAERARILRMHGSKPKYFHREVGGNFRLDPLQAALPQGQAAPLRRLHQGPPGECRLLHGKVVRPPRGGGGPGALLLRRRSGRIPR